MDCPTNRIACADCGKYEPLNLMRHTRVGYVCPECWDYGGFSTWGWDGPTVFERPGESCDDRYNERKAR